MRIQAFLLRVFQGKVRLEPLMLKVGTSDLFYSHHCIYPNRTLLAHACELSSCRALSGAAACGGNACHASHYCLLAIQSIV